ncbi:hypothetical protein [Allohahella sp. A8]|uniref:hypothetical protein n=1 Tax=Allohahella sp. A8 TaxID=3141461 RepID=UPI003A808F26
MNPNYQGSPDQPGEEDLDVYQEMGNEVLALFDQAVKDRKPYERRMLKNLRQYHGEYEEEEMPEDGSRVFTNITRNKVDAAAARMVKIVLPNGEQNWKTEHTPVPELSSRLNSTRPVALNDQAETTEGDIAQAELSEVKAASEAMGKEIEDQLEQSGYDAIQREIIYDAAKLGTGVIKGPVMIGDERRVWATNPETGQQELQVVRRIEPRSKRVNPFYWFPDMSATRPEEREYDFELSFMTRRGVQDLLKYPHYNKEQVKRVLQMKAADTQKQQFEFLHQIQSITGERSKFEDSRYYCVEYYGPIKREWLAACGCPPEELDENVPEPYGLMLIIGGHVVMADIHPMSKGESIYDFFNWEKDDASVFGLGIPDQMRTEQSMYNALNRMLMDNGGLATGPQIVIRDGYLTPADNDYEMKPRKIWRFDDKGQDGMTLDNVIKAFDIPSRLGDIMAIASRVREMADEATSLPMIAQGEQGSGVTKTFQGMAMLMESANIVIARAVKSFDDMITTPHVSRYYDWNMEFNPKAEIKGDIRVVAKGTTALLQRETRMIEIQNLIQIAGTMFAPIANMEKIFEEYLILNDFDPELYLLKPDPNAQPEVDPAIAAQQQAEQAKLQAQEREFELRAQQQQLEAARAQQEFQLGMAKLALDREMTLEKLYAELGMKQQEFDMQELIAGMQSNDKLREMQLKLQVGSGI